MQLFFLLSSVSFNFGSTDFLHRKSKMMLFLVLSLSPKHFAPWLVLFPCISGGGWKSLSSPDTPDYSLKYMYFVALS